MSLYDHRHLEGRTFDFGTQDCLSLVRDFYLDMFGISIRNYARPNLFWQSDKDFYHRLTHREGFRVLDCHPSEYQFGDLVLMSVNSTLANHAGMLVENDHILHHLMNQMSACVPYRGLTRNSTVAVMRHKDVVLKRDETPLNILDTLSPQRRKKIEDELARFRAEQAL